MDFFNANQYAPIWALLCVGGLAAPGGPPGFYTVCTVLCTIVLYWTCIYMHVTGWGGTYILSLTIFSFSTLQIWGINQIQIGTKCTKGLH